ncbi:MAG: hypothetical protein V9E93_15630 [Steroidobacteraceae bacterium]
MTNAAGATRTINASARAAPLQAARSAICCTMYNTSALNIT